MVCVRWLGPWVGSAFPLGRGSRLPVQPWAGSGRVTGTERGCLGATFSWASQTCYRSEMSTRPYATGLTAAGGISDGGGDFRRHRFSWRKQILGERALHCVACPSFSLPLFPHTLSLSLSFSLSSLLSFFSFFSPSPSTLPSVPPSGPPGDGQLFFQSVFAVRMLRVRCQDAPLGSIPCP